MILSAEVHHHEQVIGHRWTFTCPLDGTRLEQIALDAVGNTEQLEIRFELDIEWHERCAHGIGGHPSGVGIAA